MYWNPRAVSMHVAPCESCADTPPSKRVGRRASKRAREELAMLEREARPKQKPVKTL